jgi:hypothetical protein
LPKLTPERSPIEEELDLATFKAVWLGQQHHDTTNECFGIWVSFKFTTFAFNNGTILIA